MKRFLLSILTVLLAGAAPSHGQVPDRTIEWAVSSRQTGPDTFELTMKGSIADDWHTYSLNDELERMSVEIEPGESFSLVGKAYEITTPTDYEGEKVFFKTVRLGQEIKLSGNSATVKGVIRWQSCKGEICAFMEEYGFSVNLKKDSSFAAVSSTQEVPGNDQAGDGMPDEVMEHSTPIADPTGEESGSGSLWTLIIEAILWGFAMLLTPCVFPMVPMTISFFMKGSSNPSAGRFKAFMYGFFIVLLYTLPISIIIGITWLFGGDTVTADIFNWLATHWLPNILFFIIFMVFAASFFGAFEITLPSSLVNKSDRNSDKKGLAGVFFMALTLVLVSFSCTGPIVGSVLIKSTQGEFWTPMITMLAFSVAFALPFTVFALFPSLLTKLKSGSWLNSVKVVLGFIEIALGFKFLSIPDQTYHWGILDRDVYLAIWIVVFTLLGLYLLGKIRFAHDDKVEHIGVFRLTLVIAVFSFVVYLIPGMFGAPLKALSGYMPPLKSQEFVIGQGGSDALSLKVPGPEDGDNHKLPYGLTGYLSLEKGLAAAKAAGKPLFVDITGHGCTNCREMEAKVWSAPEVLSLLKNEFILTALYTDDKRKLEEKDWVTTDNGKVLKDMGRANSYIVRTRFGLNSQPNYIILSPEGELLAPIRGYNLDIKAYADFLRSGLQAYRDSR